MIGIKRWKDQGNKRRSREKDHEQKCKETRDKKIRKGQKTFETVKVDRL